MYPYILTCGTFQNFTQICVVFKGEKYSYPTLTKAVEALFKCFFALRSAPVALNSIFYFFNKAIFKLNLGKQNLANVNILVTDAGL